MADRTFSARFLDSFSSMGRALKHRNYRLFFMGQAVSLVGTWITRVAMSWLVYRITGSAWVLGVVGFASQLPTFLLSPIAGALVDRWDRHRTLVVTQIFSLVQSALLCLVTVTGRASVWNLLALAALQGAINAFDTPARQAFVIDMVNSREELPNAIALNSSMVNASRLIGPAVAGVLIASIGEGWCFGLDALSYVAVIASLLAMTELQPVPRRAAVSLFSSMREGYDYVSRFPPIRALLLMLALASMTGVPYTTLMPIFATRVLHGGAHTLGYLMGASGLGATCGALWMASRKSVIGLDRIIPISIAVLGVSLCLFAKSTTLWIALPLLTVVGGGMIIGFAAINTMLQTLADSDKRGRVMSFGTMAFFGVIPFGSLLAGWLGDRVGVPTTVLITGVLALVGVAVFAAVLPGLQPHIRPVYERLGILPVVATGLRDATAELDATKQ